ncbi:MAG: DNA polymerase III subunit gamma/tau [Bacteroidetes bacterium]|nr:DNA polymerase III subunit gamma/tau [Bacteroidota bacterium]
MDNFIVSARKYRPATFDTVVGQQSITNTLKNAIRNNQLAQAFLFCGPRGVGKTTCARILAKTINCEHPTANIEPCNECTSCVTFNESSSFNIHELDAASNNSVDDIRNLVDQVRIPPQMGRYKVYIIDEVHMLSTQAFNAFLKTLEEPPAYAKFILATTEKHKIIPTILSRCQIFDFKRITIQDISSHLVYVSGKENVIADPEALHIIAQKADGALRDALSIFDQMVNLGNRNISRELVIENLNVLDYDYYFRIIDYMLSGNYRDVLLILNEIYEKGFEGQHFISGLGDHLRNLLMCQDAATVMLIETSESVRTKYLLQAKSSPVLFLINTLDIINKCDVTYRTVNNKRLTLEVALIQMCQIVNPLQQSSVPPAIIQPSPAASVISAQQAQTVPISTPQQIQSVQPSQPVIHPTPEPFVEAVKQDEIPEKKPEIAAALPEMPKEVSKESEIHTEPLQKYQSASMHSIKDLMSQGAKVAPKVEEGKQASDRNEAFSEDQLITAFGKYAESIRENSAMLYSALTKHKPQLRDNFGILITLDNLILQKEINEAWIELQGFLKNELRNDLIRMEVEITKNPTENKKFLSDSDKLEAMKQKNPEVGSLTDQLNLELDIS